MVNFFDIKTPHYWDRNVFTYKFISVILVIIYIEVILDALEPENLLGVWNHLTKVMANISKKVAKMVIFADTNIKRRLKTTVCAADNFQKKIMNRLKTSHIESHPVKWVPLSRPTFTQKSIINKLGKVIFCILICISGLRTSSKGKKGLGVLYPKTHFIISNGYSLFGVASSTNLVNIEGSTPSFWLQSQPEVSFMAQTSNTGLKTNTVAIPSKVTQSLLKQVKKNGTSKVIRFQPEMVRNTTKYHTGLVTTPFSNQPPTTSHITGSKNLKTLNNCFIPQSIVPTIKGFGQKMVLMFVYTKPNGGTLMVHTQRSSLLATLNKNWISLTTIGKVLSELSPKIIRLQLEFLFIIIDIVPKCLTIFVCISIYWLSNAKKDQQEVTTYVIGIQWEYTSLTIIFFQFEI